MIYYISLFKPWIICAILIFLVDFIWGMILIKEHADNYNIDLVNFLKLDSKDIEEMADKIDKEHPLYNKAAKIAKAGLLLLFVYILLSRVFGLF